MTNMNVHSLIWLSTIECNGWWIENNSIVLHLKWIVWIQEISIPTPRRAIRTFKGEGVLKAKIFKGKYEPKLDFSEGWCCNINLWVPLCGVPYVFVGRPTSREHVSWLMSDIVLTVFNVALSIWALSKAILQQMGRGENSNKNPIHGKSTDIFRKNTFSILEKCFLMTKKGANDSMSHKSMDVSHCVTITTIERYL